MLSLRFLWLGLVWLLSSVSATNVEGSVVWTSACKDIDALHPQTKVILDSGRYKASIRKDGGFTLFNVPPGSYMLEVLARDHVFDPLRVDVLELPAPRHSSDTSESSSSSSSSPSYTATSATPSNDDESDPSIPPSMSASDEPPQVQIRPAPRGTPFHPTDSPHFQALPLLPYPIVLNPRGQKIYVVAEKGFDIIEMFKNPMMMMMLIAGSMIFLMPKMLENMDPDLVKDMRERQDKMFNLQNSLQNGDFSALKAELLSPPVQESSTSREKSSLADGSSTGASPSAPPSSSSTKKGQAASGKKAGAQGGKRKR